MNSRLIIKAAASVALLGTPLSSLALTTSLDVGASVFHSDNVNKLSTGGPSDLEEAVGATIAANHSTSSLDLDVGYDGSRTKFKNDSQQSETVVNGDASIRWAQIPSLLTWNASHSVRDVLRDKSLANTQANREGRSISTGSGVLSTRLGQANTGSLSASYSDIHFEDSNRLDSERMGGALNLSRSLGPVSTIFLTGSYEEVTFEDRRANYDRVNSMVGYSAQLSRLNYSIQLGYGEQKLEDGRTFRRPSVNINARYQNAGANWSFLAIQELTDTSRGNNNTSVSGLNNYSANLTTAEVYERRSIELSYSSSSLCAGCTWKVRGLGEQNRYDSGSNDNDEFALTTGLSYQWTRLITTGGEVEYRKVNFSGTVQADDYDIINYRFNMGFALSSDLTLGLGVEYEDYESSLGTRVYDELRGGLSLSYKIR